MMNATRGESFAIEILFDEKISTLRDFSLLFSQGGKRILQKRMKDTIIGDDERRARLTLSGRETAMFQAWDPVCVQVRAELADGGALHSEAGEINIVDALEMRGGSGWESH